jgi:hypothetical protein
VQLREKHSQISNASVIVLSFIHWHAYSNIFYAKHGMLKMPDNTTRYEYDNSFFPLDSDCLACSSKPAFLISCITPCQVANFEYIDEAKALAEKEEARRKAAAEAANSARANYWDELLKDRYDVQKVEEHTAMGKGKRSRKQVSTLSFIIISPVLFFLFLYFVIYIL